MALAMLITKERQSASPHSTGFLDSSVHSQYEPISGLLLEEQTIFKFDFE